MNIKYKNRNISHYLSPGSAVNEPVELFVGDSDCGTIVCSAGF